jgi:hypothetical protein
MSSRCSGKALTEKARPPPKSETREEEKEEDEADTQLENEWGFPTRIQLQMRDGATVNLYMNKVSERYGHTRARWQSGLVRVQTEGGVQTKRYTSTDGRDPVETLRKWMSTYKDKLREEKCGLHRRPDKQSRG